MDKHPDHILADHILAECVRLLKALRIAKGYSHETLAQRAGVTRPMISFIENGKAKPSLLVCLKIAAALDMPLGRLLTKAEKQVRSQPHEH